MIRRSVRVVAVVLLLLVNTAVLEAVEVWTVYPPHAEVEGKTLGEWAGIWWEWALAFRDGESPLQPNWVGSCSEGQRCDVWFLTGTGESDDVRRFCTLPVGRKLFFPALNLWISEEFMNEPDPCSAMCAEIRGILQRAPRLFCRIDGRDAVDNLRDHLEESPDCWGLFLPENNIYEIASRCYEPTCAVGYYVMLEFLNPGQYVLEFGGDLAKDDGGFHLDVTYTLTVEEAVEEGPFFRRGDANDDGVVNIADAVYTLQFLFLGGPPPSCHDAADSNDDGVINIADGVHTLGFLFLGVLGECSLPWPGSEECASDPTSDPLGECATQANCSCE